MRPAAHQRVEVLETSVDPNDAIDNRALMELTLEDLIHEFEAPRAVLAAVGAAYAARAIALGAAEDVAADLRRERVSVALTIATLDTPPTGRLVLRRLLEDAGQQVAWDVAAPPGPLP